MPVMPVTGARHFWILTESTFVLLFDLRYYIHIVSSINLKRRA